VFIEGWQIVGFTFMAQFVAVGLSYYAFGVFLKPLTEALDADRFSISLALSMQAIVMALLSPFAGRLLAQYSIRAFMFTGAVFLSTGFILLSQVNALWQLYILVGGFIAIGSVCLGAIPCNTLLANWFDKRRGTAIGISQFGMTISATVLVPTVTWLLIHYGWQVALLGCGIGAFVIIVPAIFKFAIKTPEEVGLHPDGARSAVSTSVPTTTAHNEWPLSRAVRNKDMWLVTLIIGPCYLGVGAVVLALPSHATDLGHTAMQGGTIVAFTTLLGAAAKPLFGTLSDYLPKRLVVAIALVCQATGIATLISVSSYSGMILAGCLFGIGYGAMSPLWALILATRFGRASLPQVLGVGTAMLLPFTLSGLPMTTWVFETTGSYLPAFTGLLGGYLIAALALFVLKLAPAQAQNSTASPTPGH